jgi:hypothetical protein
LYVPALIRIYKFGSTTGNFSNIYDLAGMGSFDPDDEQWCMKHGKLVGVIYFYANDADQYFFRTLDHKEKNSLVGQTVELPTLGDKLFISQWSKLHSETGFYITLDSGEEVIAFYAFDGDLDNGYMQSYQGWFGTDLLPSGGAELVLYHCGDSLYEFYNNNDITQGSQEY